MKPLHEMGQRFDGIEANRVVERDAHPADRAVPGRADKISCRGLLSEFLLQILITWLASTASYPKHHIHQRTRRFLHRASVKPAAGFDRVVEQLGRDFIPFLD